MVPPFPARRVQTTPPPPPRNPAFDKSGGAGSTPPMSYPSNRPETRPDDAAAGIDITDDFERFTQRNDIFTRAFWDDKVRNKKSDAFFASYRMEATPRRGDGFTQRDFALRNASWLISWRVTAPAARRAQSVCPTSTNFSAKLSAVAPSSGCMARWA